MALNNDTSSVSLVGTGSASIPYQVPFEFLANEDLSVYVTTGGVITQLSYTNGDFTVTGAGNTSGGTVSTKVAVPITSTVYIARNVSLTQKTSFITGDRFPSQAMERALDKLTMICQQMQRVFSKGIRFSDTAPVQPSLSPQTNSILGFDNNGTVTSLSSNGLTGAPPYVLGTSAAGTIPTFLSLPTFSLTDNSVSPQKLTDGHPYWDATGILHTSGTANGFKVTERTGTKTASFYKDAGVTYIADQDKGACVTIDATTGKVAAPFGFSGNVTGNVTGSVTGDVTGNVSGTSASSSAAVAGSTLQKSTARAFAKIATTATNSDSYLVTTAGTATAGAVITVTTGKVHGLAVGNTVYVSGSSNIGNALRTVTTVPSTTTFTFTNTVGILSVTTTSQTCYWLQSLAVPTILNNFNVLSITNTSLGAYTVTMTNAVNTDYSVIANSRTPNSGNTYAVPSSTTAFVLYTYTGGIAALNSNTDFAVFSI